MAASVVKCCCAHILKGIPGCFLPLVSLGPSEAPYNPATKGTSTSSHQALGNLIIAPGKLRRTGDGEWVGETFSCFLLSLTK